MNNIFIGDKKIGDNQPTYIIAEAGSNHNGDINIAKQLVDIAVDARADAVKFQTFTADNLYNKNFYANKVVKDFEFKLEFHEKIKKYCDDRKIDFLTTPFQLNIIETLESLEIKAYKIASGDLNYFPLLKKISKTKKPLILSTGMAYIDEIRESINYLKENNSGPVSLLHCVASYPTKPQNVNLRIISKLKEEFNLPVGFSDHTLGINIPVAAVALGSDIIEKHFTISRKLEGMDHFYALEPDELKKMVESIREIESSLGIKEKIIGDDEFPGRYYGRRGIIVTKDMKEGEILTEESMNCVRPSIGIEPRFFDNIIGKKLKKDKRRFENIFWEDL